MVAAPAIVAALRNATGRELNALPVTPDDLAGLRGPRLTAGRPQIPKVEGQEADPRAPRPRARTTATDESEETMSTAVGINRSQLTGRDFIETLDWSVEEIDETLAVADELKDARRRGEPHRLLSDKTIYLLFLDRSTRTRNAFETGMTQLGGHALFLDADKTQVSHGETPQDTALTLSRYGEGIAIRHDLVPGEGNAWMREIARWADIPVINMQCDIDHPTQTLADLMTLREHRGEELRGLQVAVSWAYTPSYAKPLSVPQGLAMLLPRFGMDVVLAHPPGSS